MFLWILLKIHHTYCGIQACACHWLSTTRGSKGLQKKSGEVIEDTIRLGDVVLEDIRGHFRVELRTAVESV